MRTRRLAAALLLLPTMLFAQSTFTPNDVKDVRSQAYALTRAQVTIAPGKVIDDATLLIRDGKVVSVIEGGAVPAGFVEVDVRGRYIYPGLIDLVSGYGLPDPAPRARFSFNEAEVLESQTPGAYNANQAIRSEYRAAAHFVADDKKAESLRKLGFGAVLTHMADGIARGTGAVVSTANGNENELVIEPDAAALLSFDKGSSAQAYPISPMGAIALLRQTYLDASWYGEQNPRPFTDQSLDAWLANARLPQIFHSTDWRSVLRADMVGDEFDVQYIIRGGGDEYRRIDAIRDTGARFIVGVSFPEAQDVSDPLAADTIALADLKHWELAPTNPAALAAAGVEFALTAKGAEKEFWANLRKAVAHGLSEDDALAALTTRPAAMLGMQDRLGQLTEGAEANFLITSGPLFEKDTTLEENWIGGEKYVLATHHQDHSGRYELAIDGVGRWSVEVSGEPGKHKAAIPAADSGGSEAPGQDDEGAGSGDNDNGKAKDTPVTISFEDELVTLSFAAENDDAPIRLKGWMADSAWRGRGQLADGSWVDWSATRSGDLESRIDGEDDEAESETDGDDDSTPEVGTVIYPFVAYGRESRRQAEDLLFRNATVWTLEEAGTFVGDVLVRDGRIAAVGEGLDAGGARVVDASGMHLTPGIIDEHSHIALNGVNDIATNSGMVRMQDVVNPDDVGIYRNLAGGVTAAQLLHGSANPVGGQSALVKFRWGALPREMLIEGADGFIKFALGENVKRSRNPNSIRFPQTRMGVEQVYRDAFSAAVDYQVEWDAYNQLSRRQQSRTPAPRRDLVLDTMAEIISGQRYITCHSYVQSEINMLMHVAEDFDFNINTFTHILEGYKVADKMAAHGAGGSTFADWWAYKWEVRYAIPYGPALMQQAGVTVAVNSDSSEMSRRLNQEAAKSVKYGDMSEEDALKLVTLNPAKLLHLDDRMGSIKEGKDADLVLWTDNPLSIYAIPDQTLVDGIVYFDRETDQVMRDAIRDERARLIAKMAKAKGNGGNGKKPPSGRPGQVFQCDSVTGYEYLSELQAH